VFVVLSNKGLWEMKAYEEQDTIDAVRNIKRLAGRLKEADLLEVLARDDQPNNTREPDLYHRSVRSICGEKSKGTGLIGVSHTLANAVSVLGYLLEKAPRPGRISTLEDCLACGEPVFGKVKGGLCGSCQHECRQYCGTNRGKTRADFLTYKRSTMSRTNENETG
jgi:hypothetical protein